MSFEPWAEEMESEFFSRYDYRREAFAATEEIAFIEDCYPSEAEMLSDGWFLNDDGMWEHPEVIKILDSFDDPDHEIPF